MSRCSRSVLLLAGLVLATWATAMDGPLPVPADGVRLEAPTTTSPNIRLVIPAEEIDRRAQAEYRQIVENAAKEGALAPDNVPDLIRIRAIVKRLIPQAPRWNPDAAHWQWQVNLIGANQVNAFCMPGGKIAVFSGLVEQLRLTDDELAMALGHEIAHALREHARARAGQREITNLGANVISQLFGFGNRGDTDLGEGAKMHLLAFSRAEETEADLVGMDIASRAGYDPRAALTLWQKMGSIGGAEQKQFLSTHPSGRTRMAVLSRHLPETLPLFADALHMPMGRLPEYRSNMQYLGAAPVDNGDEAPMRPMVRR
ncbi:M48 family metallopeptidase [Ralstonia mannitolilytica]|uniref:Beta-barrel assembly-enhancing protease n=1 Tax=Ralstonia mannitolilytica TaxID=105219 RepID=A0AAD2B055_9RALS|nr:M48 family metallopeptidase [Ralstonia mannitolilytica]MBY4717919.1 M48 family metallopeptidase [Ralstonia mannitolilytica]CAJ0697143.1 Beta-barrel assembly-enhancing protease [Ralstonia mannitolilytica]CAJ0705161.1 Beta-barrel assembly-enhancing protease [Ralstonia mannitolilytica]CAJ0718220.1 Beta-barrel assembly-enhancing protease [Ralstonia mannitolilytica]CAJ0879690.1 Beta-barrel assembly-enhancing protease [Ralstonia mannitolilytica]